MRLRSFVSAIALACAGLAIVAPAEATAPAIGGYTQPTQSFYPAPDGYQDTATINWFTYGTETTAHADVLNADNVSVWSADVTNIGVAEEGGRSYAITWRGVDNDGALVPAGVYTFALTVSNGSESSSGTGDPLTVSLKRLVAKTFTKQVTASGSLKAKFVGGCSTLRKPGLKLGSGSLGFYSQNKCNRTANMAGTVTTLHGLTLPAALRPGKVRIATYGMGLKRGSYGVLVPLDKTKAVIEPALSKLGAPKGWHAGIATAATSMMTSTRLIRWGVVAFDGSRYDVKYFKVTYTYTVLV